MAKKFFYVCAGVFLLALSYHLGAESAKAQGPTPGAQFGFAVDASNNMYVMTDDGNVFLRMHNGINGLAGPVYPMGNFWAGGPTPAKQESWGTVKQRYR